MNSAFDHIAIEEERKWIEMSKKDIGHFKPLYSKYYESIFRFIYRRTDDEALAADLCSQTFYKALSNIKKFKWQNKPLAPWLFKIASNEIKKHFRNRREIFVIEEDKLMDTPELKDEWKYINQDKLYSLLNTLDDLEIRLIELKYFEGNTFSEIGIILEKKESAVKMRLYRLLNKLKRNLEDHHVTV